MLIRLPKCHVSPCPPPLTPLRTQNLVYLPPLKVNRCPFVQLIKHQTQIFGDLDAKRDQAPCVVIFVPQNLLGHLNPYPLPTSPLFSLKRSTCMPVIHQNMSLFISNSNKANFNTSKVKIFPRFQKIWTWNPFFLFD